MINLSWLVRKRKLRLTLEAIWVTTTSLTLSSHVTMETFFFFYCINELSYLRWGRKLYGPACTSPSIYPTEKLSQVWCRGKELQAHPSGGEEGGWRGILPSPVCAAGSGVQQGEHIAQTMGQLVIRVSKLPEAQGKWNPEGSLHRTIPCSTAKRAHFQLQKLEIQQSWPEALTATFSSATSCTTDGHRLQKFQPRMV